VSETFVVHAPEFEKVLGGHPRLDCVVEVDAHEGPVYVADEDALYFTTLSGDGRSAIKRFELASRSITTVVADANGANGMTADGAGNLVICEQGSRREHARISRLDRATGSRETIVDGWDGARFNSPNDVVVTSDGVIWFTDPSYGALQGFKDAPELGDFVYRHDPATGHTAVVADGFDKPNGIAVSPGERMLYVTDSGANQEPGSFHVNRPHHIEVFDVHGGRHLRNRRLFAITHPGFPDGLKVDIDGHVYASSFRGVQVFDTVGELIGEIVLPGAVNFTFAGPERNVLMITADQAVWSVALDTKGIS
jgi:gluconolactonase